MVNDELFAKLKSDIKKSGFLLELDCKRKLLNKGFAVASTQYFTNPSGNINEIDTEGSCYTSFKNNDINITLFTKVIVECKKSINHPWVFFYENWMPHYNLYSVNDRIVSKLNGTLYQSNSEHHYDNTPAARSYMVGLCKPNAREHSVIFYAISNLIEYFEFEKAKCIKLRGADSNGVDITYLTIVVDGMLCLAETDNNDLKLSETDHVIVNYCKENHDETRNKYYSIDVVNIHYMDSFLDLIKNDHDIICKRLTNLEL